MIFGDVVFHENTSSKIKFRSKVAELFWVTLIFQLNCANEKGQGSPKKTAVFEDIVLIRETTYLPSLIWT